MAGGNAAVGCTRACGLSGQQEGGQLIETRLFVMPGRLARRVPDTRGAQMERLVRLPRVFGSQREVLTSGLERCCGHWSQFRQARMLARVLARVLARMLARVLDHSPFKSRLVVQNRESDQSYPGLVLWHGLKMQSVPEGIQTWNASHPRLCSVQAFHSPTPLSNLSPAHTPLQASHPSLCAHL